MTDEQPHLYTNLADWYPLLTAPAEYAEEAAFVLRPCRPGGVAVFAPDHVRENVAQSTEADGHDAPARAAACPVSATGDTVHVPGPLRSSTHGHRGGSRMGATQDAAVTW